MLPYRHNYVKILVLKKILLLSFLKIFNAYMHMIFKNKLDYTVHATFHQYIPLKIFNEKVMFYCVYFTIALLLNIYVVSYLFAII